MHFGASFSLIRSKKTVVAFKILCCSRILTCINRSATDLLTFISVYVRTQGEDRYRHTYSALCWKEKQFCKRKSVTQNSELKWSRCPKKQSWLCSIACPGRTTKCFLFLMTVLKAAFGVTQAIRSQLSRIRQCDLREHVQDWDGSVQCIWPLTIYRILRFTGLHFRPRNQGMPRVWSLFSVLLWFFLSVLLVCLFSLLHIHAV